MKPMDDRPPADPPLHRDGGRTFWIMTAIGWAVIVAALIGAFGDRRDAQPTQLARWLAASALLHDLVWLPVVAVAGALLARVARGRAPRAVIWALATSAVLILISWPFVRGYGRNRNNPSLLPRSYSWGLVAYLVVTWALAGLAMAIGHWRAARHAEHQ